MSTFLGDSSMRDVSERENDVEYVQRKEYILMTSEQARPAPLTFFSILHGEGNEKAGEGIINN